MNLAFRRPSPATGITATPLYISDHRLLSFTITLLPCLIFITVINISSPLGKTSSLSRLDLLLPAP